MDYSSLEKNELIDIIKTQEQKLKYLRYGIFWEREKVKEKVVVDCENNLPILTEYPKRNIISKEGFNDNIFIEGDNYHSLTVLNYTHHEKIDVIYIDPPYNTGHTENNDFKYNDCYIDEEDCFRHSKWLNFMEKRLKIARELLTKDGVIFISIDDNEYANLKLLCDSIFSEKNFVGVIIQNKGNAQNDAKNIQKNHEYVLVYRKEKLVNENNKEIPILRKKVFEAKEIFKDEYGYYYKNGAIVTGGEGGILNRRPNLGYTIYYNPTTGDKIAVMDYDVTKARTSNDEEDVYKDDVTLLNKGYVKIRPPRKGDILGVWTWSQEKFNKEKNNILISPYGNTYSVSKKQYVDKSIVKKKNGSMYIEVEKYANSKSIIDFSTAKGTSALSELIGNKKFNNPKNPDMLEYLIGLYYRKDITVLDFFAGSGTTAQAVLNLNKQDGAKRKFILCTNNENGICDTVTFPRLLELSHEKTGMYDYNLRYFKTDFITKPATKDEQKLLLSQHCAEMLCLKENIFNKIVDNASFKIYNSNDNTKHLGVYLDLYDEEEIKKFRNELKKLGGEKIVYVFSFDNYTDSSLIEGIDNCRIEPIPTRILETYKNTQLLVRD